VPETFESSSGPTAPRNILLLEEYDALAAAIGSALEKFAPQHATAVASSLAEAEVLAEKLSPALIVVDFDPAYPGLTEFFWKIRDAHPDTRVLVIGAGLSDKIAAEWRSLGALQFIQKPFETADFGAAVQALLGPWKDSHAQPRGTLRSITLADVILLQCAGGRSVVVQVSGPDGKSGEVHVTSGQLVHAKAGRRTDGDALEEMFGWFDPHIHEAERPSSAPRTIHAHWAALVFDALREARPRQPAPVSPAPAIKTGKKIVAVDDTEMLLIFVEDALTTADPELQITTALNGMSGLKQIEHVMPDLVLLDYSLPDLTGREVCIGLLQNEKTARIPVLMMSGHVPEMLQAAADLDNVVATIAKPFLSEAFVALVKQTLEAAPVPKPKVLPQPKPVKPPVIATPPPVIATPPVIEKISAVVAEKPIERPPAIAPMVRSAPALLENTWVSPMSAPVFSTQPNDVVLALFLEVLSMQLTSTLRMGTIRAKPSSSAVSLRVSPAALRAALPVETGFELGRVELDANGRIATVRLIPTLQPFQRLPTRNAFDIGGVAVVPINSHEQVQLTSTTAAPMRMQLLSHFELAGVELSGNFQVAQLVLKTRSNKVRVTLSSEAIGPEQTGATCETAVVQLDNSAKLAELLLNPIK
jgi:DNA-binding response OmpR family regulator